MQETIMAESCTSDGKNIPELVELTGELDDGSEASNAQIPVMKEVAIGDEAPSVCECPVCHEDYVRPKILPCGHLVCQKCVLLWVDVEGRQATCPLCRACILSPDLPDMADPTVEVDAWPTDLHTAALVESRRVLRGPHICGLCENDATAESYCIPCGLKLCAHCVKSHKKIPATKMHPLEDIDSLSSQTLEVAQPVMCKTHPERVAELYCSGHQEVICILCGTTSHGCCADKKTAVDMERDIKGELDSRVQNLKLKEEELENQVRKAKDHFKTQHKKVKDMFDDLQQMLDTQRQKFDSDIQAEEDIVMTSLTAVEKTRATLTQNATTVGHLVQSASGASVLQMQKALMARLDHLEKQAERTKAADLADFTLDLQQLNHLKGDITELGQHWKKMPKGGSRAAATFHYSVEQISTLRESAVSPSCMIRNLPWKILVMPKQNAKHQKTLGVYLQCGSESESESWFCNARAELRLLSVRSDVAPYCCELQLSFSSKNCLLGLSDFFPWDKMLDPERGFVRGDKITIQVHVVADVPQRI